MSETSFTSFKTTEDKTNRILHEIEQIFDWSKEQRTHSYAALRAVLHALRDRLPVNEAAQLGAQLPMLVRGIYYTGWNPSAVPMKMTHDEFMQRVEKSFGYDFDGDTRDLVDAVLIALRNDFITDGEWDDVRSVLPKDLADALP